LKRSASQLIPRAPWPQRHAGIRDRTTASSAAVCVERETKTAALRTCVLI